MSLPAAYKPTPWDSAIFGVDSYEITEPSRAMLEIAARIPGHHTVRVDPSSYKGDLHANGFYYCDTLVEPYCSPERFVAFDHPGVGITRAASLESLLSICHGAFSHDRFHRDFNLSPGVADARYNR